MSDRSPSKRTFGWPFWLVVLGVLLVWASFAVPNFTRARATPSYNSCQVQLRQIDGALQQWSLQYKKRPTDIYSLDDPAVLAYLKRSELPLCPAGGHYSPGTNLADKPKGSIPDHTL
jgi:type II secretory pathway pseudopilin PulG